MATDSIRRPKRKSAAGSVQARKTRQGTRRSDEAERRALELRTLQGFRTIIGSARRHDSEVRRIAGISGSQLWALAEIARSAAMSVNELSEQMALHQTTASNLVNALVERRLIRRVRDAADQRIVRLHVTTDGKRMLLRAPGPYTGLLVDAIRHLDSGQLAKVRNGLAVLLGVLRDTATDSAGQTLLGE